MLFCPFTDQITEVVCGCARGVDQAGLTWARLHKLPVAFFPAWPDQYRWAKINMLAGELLVYPEGGYAMGKGNGFHRNKLMAAYSQALVAAHDGVSSGTVNMVKLASERKLLTSLHTVNLQQAIPF